MRLSSSSAPTLRLLLLHPDTVWHLVTSGVANTVTESIPTCLCLLVCLFLAQWSLRSSSHASLLHWRLSDLLMTLCDVCSHHLWQKSQRRQIKLGFILLSLVNLSNKWVYLLLLFKSTSGYVFLCLTQMPHPYLSYFNASTSDTHRQSHYVFRLFVRPSICAHVCTSYSCEQEILTSWNSVRVDWLVFGDLCCDLLYVQITGWQSHTTTIWWF